MKIIFLTPGTGTYYCGACMRDNMLARELHRAGHDVTIVPMYLPLILDEMKDGGVRRTPIFFGGINVYLQQKVGFFRQSPAFLDRLFNFPILLRWAARHSHMTSARDHGEMTLEMLHVSSARFRKEFDKLLDWLETQKPHLVCLSNALLAGFARELKQRLRVPVATFFQGEDSFLDSLPEPYRKKCWASLAEQIVSSDHLIAPSRSYANFMLERLDLRTRDITVLPNGIRLDGYEARTAEPATPAIGFLARMNRDKGLELLVEAFMLLARDLGDDTTRLKIAGAATPADEPLISELKRRLEVAGLSARVEWWPNVERNQKIEFLRSLTLFSTPAVYMEAFGLYVIEAMACGIPIVQPNSSAFPEIIRASGGGICVQPRDALALARGWKRLLAAPAERAELSRSARAAVEQFYSTQKMAEHFCHIVGPPVSAAV